MAVWKATQKLTFLVNSALIQIIVPSKRRKIEHKSSIFLLTFFASLGASADEYRARIARVQAYFGDEIAKVSREFAYRGKCADTRIIAGIVATEVGGLSTKTTMIAARGAAGEVGLMQIHPATAMRLGVKPNELIVPEKNLRAGVRYFCDLVHEWVSLRAALAAYNAGPGRYVAILFGGGMPHELEYPARVASHARHLGLRF